MVGVEKKLANDPDMRSRYAIGSKTRFLPAFKNVVIKKIPDSAAGILKRSVSFDKRRKGRLNHKTGIGPCRGGPYLDMVIAILSVFIFFNRCQQDVSIGDNDVSFLQMMFPDDTRKPLILVFSPGIL
jgi:hypothetical protein